MREKYYRKKDLKRFFWPHEWKKIYRLANPRQQFTLSFLIGTGARINEARHVKVEDIDFKRKFLTLKVTKVRAKLKETRPSPRTIAISTQLTRQIKKHIINYKLQSTDYLKIHSTEGVDTFLKSLAKKAKIKDWMEFSAHNIRKTFGTYLLALGVNGYKVAQHLGHSPEILRIKYASPDIFSFKDKEEMKNIIGDVYLRLREDYIRNY